MPDIQFETQAPQANDSRLMAQVLRADVCLTPIWGRREKCIRGKADWTELSSVNRAYGVRKNVKLHIFTVVDI